MAVFAADLDSRLHLAVEVAIAVRVLRKVAVHALHADLGMDRTHVHGFLELVGVVVADLFALCIKKISLAILFEDRTEIPTMTVVIRELGVLGFRIDVGPNVFQEFDVGPQSAQHRLLRIAVQYLHLLHQHRQDLQDQHHLGDRCLHQFQNHLGDQ